MGDEQSIRKRRRDANESVAKYLIKECFNEVLNGKRKRNKYL